MCRWLLEAASQFHRPSHYCLCRTAQLPETSQKPAHPLPAVSSHGNSIDPRARNDQASPWHQCRGPRCQQVVKSRIPPLELLPLAPAVLGQGPQNSGSPGGVLRWAAPASPGSLLEMRVLGPLPAPASAEALGEAQRAA